jgi:type III pantothenate kinase
MELSMLLCIDIGNTNTVLGVSRNGNIIGQWRIRTEKDATADELGIIIRNLLTSSDIKMTDIQYVIISCVVPSLLNGFEQLSHNYFHVKPMIVGPGLKTGMPIIYDNPKEVGADRIVNAVAAYEKYRTALIIVDFGTATTFDCVSKEGAWIGGVIAPGMIISCEALFEKASKLPRVEIFAKPKNVIARDTVGAMNVGIIYGFAGLVDGIINRIKKEMGEDLKVIATGGIAPLVFGESETIECIEESLTLEGLMIIFKRNR